MKPIKPKNYSSIPHLHNSKLGEGDCFIGLLPSIFSEDYLKWVKQANLPPLTNTQHKFAEWLLEEGNSKVIAQIGDLDSVFTSVRRWVKNGR
jgi:hypothetical protein